jgi:hypothetical protein
MTTPLAIPGGDAFPLMKAGSTTIGQNNQDDWAKLFFQGLLFGPGASGYVRSGVLSRANFSGTEPLELKVIENGNAQSVQVYPGLFVVQRGDVTPPDRGVRWGGALGSTPMVVNMPAAPGANTRYDGVFARILDKNITQDSGSSLTNNGPYIDVVSGVVGGSLNINATKGTAGAPPATPDGYLPLAYVARATNDNNIGTAEITDVRRGALIAGTPRVMLPYDISNISTDTGRMLGEERYRPASGGYPAFVDRWDGTIWRGTCGPVRFSRPAQTASGNLGANTSVSVASGKLTIAWPGFPYQITALGQVLWSSTAIAAVSGEINVDSDLYTAPSGGGNTLPVTTLGWNYSQVFANGQTVLSVDARNTIIISDGLSHVLSFWIFADPTNGANAVIGLGSAYKFDVEIKPV